MDPATLGTSLIDGNVGERVGILLGRLLPEGISDGIALGCVLTDGARLAIESSESWILGNGLDDINADGV